MKWGIIGTGNMGSMLTVSFLNSGVIKEKDLFLYNRSSEKPKDIQKQFPDIQIASNLPMLAVQCERLFICVKPHQYKEVLDNLKGKLTADHTLVSITSPVAVERLEAAVPCQVARVVPSITSHAEAGVSLFTYGTRINSSRKQELEHLFSHFSTPVLIEEEYIRVASDIVSCGPAFVSFLLKEWVSAAHQETGISEEQATLLTENMMVGLGELFSRKIFTLEELMERVTVKGGVTGEGLKALEKHTGSLFHEMFKATQKKHREDQREVEL
ncbi:late competence protein ComER [Halobacillus fulvus]|nr:late competence protein ComER [Halobacillus fulvus]